VVDKGDATDPLFSNGFLAGLWLGRLANIRLVGEDDELVAAVVEGLEVRRDGGEQH